MTSDPDLQQRRSLAHWRVRMAGAALIVAAIVGGLTTVLANALSSGILVALAPFTALGAAGLVLIGDEPPRV